MKKVVIALFIVSMVAVGVLYESSKSLEEPDLPQDEVDAWQSLYEDSEPDLDPEPTVHHIRPIGPAASIYSPVTIGDLQDWRRRYYHHNFPIGPGLQFSSPASSWELNDYLAAKRRKAAKTVMAFMAPQLRSVGVPISAPTAATRLNGQLAILAGRILEQAWLDQAAKKM